MELKETVSQIVYDEMDGHVENLRFTGPYEGEEFNVVIKLREEPEDFDERESRLFWRVFDLGHDIGFFVEHPEEAIAA